MRSSRAFTLIELLVVVAIIGILSSVVLVALNSTRQKGKEAAIKSEAREYVKLLALEYSDTGSYNNLRRGWVGGGTVNGQTTCEARGFAGTYAPQALAICQSIMGVLGASYDQAFLVSGSGTQYSVQVRYPSGLMFCIGSSGSVSDQVPYTGAGNLYPGCTNNP